MYSAQDQRGKKKQSQVTSLKLGLRKSKKDEPGRAVTGKTFTLQKNRWVWEKGESGVEEQVSPKEASGLALGKAWRFSSQLSTWLDRAGRLTDQSEPSLELTVKIRQKLKLQGKWGKYRLLRREEKRI
jgi:hypothetical protein